jgi:hypothetical protein
MSELEDEKIPGKYLLTDFRKMREVEKGLELGGGRGILRRVEEKIG